MQKAEVKKKFDEIVDFSGVERYIDTPVKRYSSGMYVRLAFAVAAHLDSEILIVDEVLAVGDAEFQKKCIGKMGDISKGEGRTILFVSHVLNMITSLCSTTIVLENGSIRSIGPSKEMVQDYISSKKNTEKIWDPESSGDYIAEIISARVTDSKGNTIQEIDYFEDSYVEYSFRLKQAGFQTYPNIHVFDQNGNHVFVTADENIDHINKTGDYISKLKLPKKFLNTGIFTFGLVLTSYPGSIIHFDEKDALTVEVKEDIERRGSVYTGPVPGVVRPEMKWETIKIDRL
jgi:lipopolysaccharide transport system ATP-binding protein